MDGAKFVSLFGEEVKVCASIQTLDGISAHADRDQLIDWIAAMEVRPKRVFVNHGSDGVCDNFAKVITERLGIEATAPYSGDAYDPVSGAQLAVGSRHESPWTQHRADAKILRCMVETLCGRYTTDGSH